jgi:repressor of nif and glnA expression
MKIAKTAPDALKILWKEKVFLKPKDVNTIESELEKRGYNFTDKNLMMALKSAKFLTRKGQAGSYSYVQKYPFIGDDRNGK